MPEYNQKQLDTRHLEATSSARLLTSRDTRPLDVSQPWVLEFRVVGSATTVQVSLKEIIVLGRADPERNAFPEIDLTPFDALAKGVSRRHAVIMVRAGKVTVKDLDSTNGTRLNNFELIRGNEYRLRHGDELSLGQLQLQVAFNVVPARQDTDDSSIMKQGLNIPRVGAGQHVMIVADDPDVSAVFQLSLARAGYRVSSARLADTAVRELSERLPALVVIDMSMPDESGLDLVRFIRKSISQQLPVVVTSGATAGYHQSKALAAGANSFLGKPVSVQELVKTVAQTVMQPTESRNAPPTTSDNQPKSASKVNVAPHSTTTPNDVAKPEPPAITTPKDA